MKIYQTLAISALAFEGELARNRREDTNPADYDEARRVEFDTEPENRTRSLGGGSAGTRSYSMRKDMISAQLMARGLPYFYYHFHDYGCYCIAQNKETNPLKNRGKPLDAVDSICQAHSKCQQCVFADSDGSINPKSTGYQMTINRQTGDITCDGKKSYPKKYQQNGTWQARYNACLCDRELAVNLADAAAAGKHNKQYEDHNGSMCGVKTKPVRVTSALEESDLMAGGGFGQGGAGIQMNAMNAAGFESGSDIQIFGSDGFQTFGSGKDVFVSENVGECCGSYPKRVPIPHSGTIAAQQCCEGELRPNGSC
jgi:hypothetical protein